MTNIATIGRTAARETRPVVIALHCSGSSGRQWRHLAEMLGEQSMLIAPDLIGNGANRHWNGERPFRLADEAALVVDIIDAVDEPVHLVGHSYGGGVALRAAIERPHRVASLSLYEPTPFHILKSMGPEGRQALQQIRAIAAAVDRGVITGAYQAAAERFVDYWNGPGTWRTMKPEVRDEVVRYVPKACLDFRALIEERLPLVAYRRPRTSVLLLQGERMHEPVALIAQRLASVMKPVTTRVIAGAGHMGPFSHAAQVNRAIVEHMAATDPRLAGVVAVPAALPQAA